MTVMHEDISPCCMLWKGKKGSPLLFACEFIVMEKRQKKKSQHVQCSGNKYDGVITQIAQPQASWGQDVQADGADEGWGWAVGGGIQRHRRWGGGRHPVALQTQEELPGFVHVYCIPLHAFDYHRLKITRKKSWTIRKRGGGEGANE